jgi:hypothetical protein
MSAGRRWADDPTRLRAATSVVAVAALLLVGVSWVTFGNTLANNDKLRTERATACAINRLVLPGTRLYALGDPVMLVLSHRVNPDRYIYLNSGVDAWKVSHTQGGFDGWTAQIAAAQPSVIVVGGWEGPYRLMMKHWLHAVGYHGEFVGKWKVFLSPEARIAARSSGIQVTRFPTKEPLTSTGANFTERTCRQS